MVSYHTTIIPYVGTRQQQTRDTSPIPHTMAQSSPASTPMGSGSDSSSSSSSSVVSSSSLPISPDNLTVQLLARLDTQSYNNAIALDAASLSHNFLFPYDFPWARFRRYYDKNAVPPSTETFVDKQLPYDIDELDSICYYTDRVKSTKKRA